MEIYDYKRYNLHQGVVFRGKFSETAFQLTHPGLNKNDFTLEKDLTLENIDVYIQEIFYSIYAPLKKIYFKCLDCNSTKADKFRFIGHTNSKKHLKTIDSLNIRLFYLKICDLCQLLLLGTSLELLENHFTSTEHKSGIKNRLQFLQEEIDAKGSGQMRKYGWSGDMSENCENIFFSISSVCAYIENHVSEGEETLEASKSLLNMLEKDIVTVLYAKYSAARVHFFGSRISGLAKQDSDVDVFVNLGVSCELNDVAQMFEEFSSLFVLERIVDTAKVPILILIHITTSLRCDLNVKGFTGVYNSFLIRTYMDVDARIRWLSTAVHAWASLNSIRGTKKFTSYSLTWLVLFCLMQPSVALAPSVRLLQILFKGDLKLMCDGWDCSFTRDIEEIKKYWDPQKCSKTSLELLEHFFTFYATLKPKKVVLFTRSGEILSRYAYASPTVGRGIHSNPSEPHGVKIGGPFILIDPFNLKENLLKSVDENLADHFQLICRKTLRCGWLEEHIPSRKVDSFYFQSHP